MNNNYMMHIDYYLPHEYLLTVPTLATPLFGKWKGGCVEPYIIVA